MAIAVGLLCASAGAGHSAGAGRKLAVLDFYGSLDVRTEATVLALDLAGRLEAAGARVTPRSDLLRTVTRIAGRAPRYALTLEPARVPALRKALGLDGVVRGELRREGTRLQATATLYRGGQQAKTVHAAAGYGQLQPLVEDVSRKVSSRLGLAPAQGSHPPVEALIPLAVAAQDLLAQHPDRAMAAVLSGGAASASPAHGARGVLSQLTGSQGLTFEQRLLLQALAGPPADARHLLKQCNATPTARRDCLAARALLLLRKGDHNAAAGLLKRGPTSALERLARATLAQARGQQRRRDRLLLGLLDGPLKLAALHHATQIPADTIGRRLLSSCYTHARSLEPERYQALISAIGLRAALRAKDLGLPLEQPLRLVRVAALDAAGRRALLPLVRSAVSAGLAVGDRLQGELQLLKSDPAAASLTLQRAVAKDPEDLSAHRLLGRTLAQQGKHREAATHFRVALDDRRPATRLELARQLQHDGQQQQVTALLAEEQDPETRQTLARSLRLGQQLAARESRSGTSEDGAQKRLARLLEELLEAVPPLKGGQIPVIVLAPLSHDRGWAYSPFRAHPEQLRAALAERLARPPFNFEVTSHSRPVDQLTPTALRTLAPNPGLHAALLYDVHATATGKARLRLVYYHGHGKDLLEVKRMVAGRPLGLVSPNLPLLGGVSLVFVLLAGAFTMRRLQGHGAVRLRLTMEPGTSSHAFVAELTRSPTPPRIADPEAFTRQIVEQPARQRGRKATHIHALTLFEKVRPGSYHLHLYGTYVKAGLRRVLPSEHSQQVTVTKDGTTQVHFDLVPSSFSLRLFVYDGDEAVRAAEVTVGGKRRLTDGDGALSLQLQRGVDHPLTIVARGMTVKRRLRHDDTQTHTLTINLAKERVLSDGTLADVADFAQAPPQQPLHDLLIEDDFTAATAPSPAPPATAATAPQLARTPSPPAATGAQAATGLRRYRPDQELGRGAMGVVYRAHDVVLERDVALKVIGADLQRHPKVRQMFMQEAKALAALNHPNVVMVHDQGEDGDQTFMVMELIEGTSLEQSLEEGPVLVPLGLDVACQLCRGLAYAHERQIIHRDIKPANIFISHDGVVKLGDFGLARVLDQLVIQRTEVKGTPLYMSPEQIRGTNIDHRADIYSLGCTLYAMFTGRPPFVQGEILYHHLHSQPLPPSRLISEIPLELEQAILACLAKDKEQRPPSATALGEALQPLLARYQ